MDKIYFGKAFKDKQGRIFIEEEKKIEVLWEISRRYADKVCKTKDADIYKCPECNYVIIINTDTRYLDETAEDRIIRYEYNYCHRCGHQNIIEKN
jgi:hypothetical protein